MLATVGMMIMGSAMDLIIVFLGLEVLSISLYILAGEYVPEIALDVGVVLGIDAADGIDHRVRLLAGGGVDANRSGRYRKVGSRQAAV
jgi:hypothetical protein